MKTLKIQFYVFLVLFILMEIVLRLCGFKAGYLYDDISFEKNPEYEQRFISDEEGINHLYSKAKNLMYGTVINHQGFRGNFDYTKQVVDSIRKVSNKKVVMVIGDSYTEGCCPGNLKNSFPDLLDSAGNYIVLNFGVAGTDPLQYQLIARKYVPLLKPDIVVTVIYFGNDILFYNRLPTPHIPICYPFKNNKWLLSIAPDHLSKQLNYHFKSPEEAYQFYIENYSVFGKNRNLFEKSLGLSVCFSKLYLYAQDKIAVRKFQKNRPNFHIDEKQIFYEDVNEIRKVCKKHSVPFLFAGIPAPSECEENLGNKYNAFFKDIPWFYTNDLTKDDYDGPGKGNHFNKDGHKKYANFLARLLAKQTWNE